MNFEQLTSLSALYQAHLRARKGQRHKGEVIRYDLHAMENLIKLQKKLETGRLKLIKYYHFKVYDPKVRDIYATNYETRVLLHGICDEILEPLVSKRLIYDNAACQKGKGTHFALKRFTHFMVQHYKRHGQSGYILKCDIHKYFDSINHAVLKKKLTRVIKDRRILALLDMIIDSYHTVGKEGVGLPLGNQTSQWFAIFYLDRLDRFLKEEKRLLHYSRYMDDFVMIHQSKQVLRQVWSEIKQELEKEKLTLNPKTQLTKLSNGVTYLGFRFSLSETGKVIRRLRGQSKIRMNKRVKQVLRDYESGTIKFEQLQSTLMSYQGHLKYGTTYRLRQKNRRLCWRLGKNKSMDR